MALNAIQINVSSTVGRNFLMLIGIVPVRWVFSTQLTLVAFAWSYLTFNLGKLSQWLSMWKLWMRWNQPRVWNWRSNHNWRKSKGWRYLSDGLQSVVQVTRPVIPMSGRSWSLIKDYGMNFDFSFDFKPNSIPDGYGHVLQVGQTEVSSYEDSMAFLFYNKNDYFQGKIYSW